MSKIDISLIEEITGKDYNVLDLVNQLEKLEKDCTEKAQHLDSIKYQLLADGSRVTALNQQIVELQNKNKADKKKHKRKYEKMRLQLLAHIVRLQSQLVKEDESKILDIANYL